MLRPPLLYTPWDKGSDGPGGNAGPQGMRGPQGISGIPGPPGLKGERGEPGPPGDAPASGIEGAGARCRTRCPPSLPSPAALQVRVQIYPHPYL